MDTIDRDIVRLLIKDGRQTHEQISKEVGLSRPAVHDRIRRLEAAGVIQSYTARVDWESLGLPLAAFIFVRTAGNCQAAAQQVFALSSDSSIVEKCDRIAGDWCLLVHTRSASTHALQDFLDSVRAIPGVQSTMTTVGLTTVVPDPAFAPPLARSAR